MARTPVTNTEVQPLNRASLNEYAAAEHEGRGAVILVVDDSPETLRLMCSLLSELGYDPRPASSGKTALEFAKVQVPELVLLDVAMDDIDGFETCRRLKALPSFERVPVIFVSILADVFDKVQAFQSGGVDYITKPVRSEEVAVRVATQLRVHRLQRELATQNSALRDRARQLEELERLRDGYIHMIIHDLRSPMTGLSLSLDLIGSLSEGNPEVEPLVEEARSSLQRVRELTELVLTINQLESGVVRLKTQKADLLALIGGVLTLGRPLFSNVPVLVEGVTEPVTCDVEMIRRVMENLLGNAVRFTPPGGRVRVVLSQHGAVARVNVEDQGVGVEPTDRERIFEKFCHGSEAHHGYGLGLSYCKLAVEAHGGRIWVEGTPGGGASFKLELPVQSEISA
jgi:two-component system, sensor histidine kinase and response regulator